MEPIVLFISAVSVLYCIIVTIRTRVEKEKDQEHQKRPKEEISQTSIINNGITDDDKTEYITDWRTNNKNTLMETPKGTKDLLLETFTKIGCQYELGEGEDTDRIYFAFQGENFVAIANNEEKYVIIWDPCWGQVELYDIDEFSRLRKAINTSNLNCSVTTVYTIDEAGKHVDVHCNTTTVFIPEIPEKENYLRAIMNGFFEAHQFVNNEIAKQRVAEEV